jgi:hypothetical protein
MGLGAGPIRQHSSAKPGRATEIRCVGGSRAATRPTLTCGRSSGRARRRAADRATVSLLAVRHRPPRLRGDLAEYGSRTGVSSMDGRRPPPEMSNFYCLPGRAGGILAPLYRNWGSVSWKLYLPRRQPLPPFASATSRSERSHGNPRAGRASQRFHWRHLSRVPRIERVGRRRLNGAAGDPPGQQGGRRIPFQRHLETRARD